jgi:hypothetical protein
MKYTRINLGDAFGLVQNWLGHDAKSPADIEWVANKVLDDALFLERAIKHTGRVVADARDQMVPYHRTGKKPAFDFMQRKTKRLLKELGPCQ